MLGTCSVYLDEVVGPIDLPGLVNHGVSIHLFSGTSMSTDSSTDVEISFNDLALNKSILKILNEVGYESPSPIQAQTIPLLLQGRDIIGQAQTGTGKTAAFALPLINNLDLKQKDPQVLVLAPTRELAIQVAEAFQKYELT